MLGLAIGLMIGLLIIVPTALWMTWRVAFLDGLSDAIHRGWKANEHFYGGAPFMLRAYQKGYRRGLDRQKRGDR